MPEARIVLIAGHGIIILSLSLLFSPALSSNSLLIPSLPSRTTSDGQLITTTVGFTTTIAPGTVVTTTPNAPATRTSSGTNTGAIVGGVIGG